MCLLQFHLKIYFSLIYLYSFAPAVKMSGGAVLGIVAVIAVIVIAILIFRSGNDSPKEQPKVNICRQKVEPSYKEYLVENNLNDLQLNDNFTDIAVVTQNVTVRAHKVILASHSTYFDTMIWLNNKTNANDVDSKNRLDLSFVDHKTVSYALNFIYTGSIPTEVFDNENEYGNLLRAANDFQLDWLKCEISKRLSIRVNKQNAGSLVVLAEETDTRFLMILASHFLLEHFNEISKTKEWKELVSNHANVLANAIDFQGKLPVNTICDILCQPSTVATPSVFTKLRRFFITQRYADAEVHVDSENGSGKKVFYVNRAVLSAQSPVFRQQFSESPNVIQMTNTSTAAADEFLVYMYSSWPAQLKKLTEGLLYLSEQYQMNALKKACEDVIINGINVQNAATIVQIADKANSKRLSSTILDFILKHLNEVVATKAWTELKDKNPELLAKIFFKLH